MAGLSTDAPRRVMIVESDRRVRRSLAGMLEAGGRMEVVAGVSSAGEALEAVVTARPDIVLIDLDRPDGDAWLALIARLRVLWPPCSIAVMSEAVTLRSCALAAGADEFINKWSSLDDMCERISHLAGVPCGDATVVAGGTAAG